MTDAADAACRIADALCENAVWWEGQCVFHGYRAPERLGLPSGWGTTGGDVYDGAAGIARFLRTIAEWSGDRTHRQTAGGALRHALEHVRGPSLFSGTSGVGLVAIEFGEVERGLDLIDAALAATDVPGPPPTDEPIDLLLGLAGTVWAGAQALDQDANDGRREVLIRAAGRLTQARRPSGAGESWPMLQGQEPHLCGLSHGASGVALALDAVARHDPGGPWRRHAAAARDWERGHYAPTEGSWADLRADDDAPGSDQGPSYPHMWCHGSVGIAIERLAAGPDDLLARADLTAALDAVERRGAEWAGLPVGPGGDDRLNGSLCHGLSGIADLLLDTAAFDPVAAAPRRTLASALGETMRRDAQRPEGPRCGIVGGHWTPGLMLGAAGIGWVQLRLALPASEADVMGSGWAIGTTMRSITQPARTMPTLSSTISAPN